MKMNEQDAKIVARELDGFGQIMKEVSLILRAGRFAKPFQQVSMAVGRAVHHYRLVLTGLENIKDLYPEKYRVKVEAKIEDVRNAIKNGERIIALLNQTEVDIEKLPTHLLH